MVKAFVTYRREDSSDIAHRLYDQLDPAFGSGNVFLDVDTIAPGADFRARIVQAMQESDIALIIIGRHWIGEDPTTGKRRIDNPNDYVRIEVELALQRGIPVLPLLVNGADMPAAEHLPEPLRSLSYRQALRVRSGAAAVDDISRVMTAVTTLVPSAGPAFVPDSLRRLGYVGQHINGVEVILPPVCRVPAGMFVMGSDPQQDPSAGAHESPQHQYYLAEFFIGKYPVTVAEFSCAVRSGAIAEPPQRYEVNWPKQQERADHPVVCITWNAAIAYAAWLSELTGARWRLPSEAEWEKAARSTDGRIYPWGNQWDVSRAAMAEGHLVSTTAVGHYGERGASPCGAQDMVGNVYEWCKSLYRPYPYRSDTGSEDETAAGFRVLRGGSWQSTQRYARTTFRFSDNPTGVHRSYGFRMAHDTAN